MINISFPDGSVRQFEAGVTPYQVAESISPRFAADVLAAKINGQDWDISRPVDTDASIELFNGIRRKANTHSGTPRHTCWPKHCKNCTPALNSVSARL